jgi:hypothetical protein
MDIINTLIGDEEDLEARLDIRKEFVQMGIIELMEVPNTHKCSSRSCLLATRLRVTFNTPRHSHRNCAFTHRSCFTSNWTCSRRSSRPITRRCSQSSRRTKCCRCVFLHVSKTSRQVYA